MFLEVSKLSKYHMLFWMGLNSLVLGSVAAFLIYSGKVSWGEQEFVVSEEIRWVFLVAKRKSLTKCSAIGETVGM